MKTVKNSSVWMAVLTFTAVIMAVVLLSNHAQTAQGAMLLDQSGFSMLTSGNGGDETLIVIDKSSLKMIAYRMNNGNLEAAGAYNFK